MTQRELTFEQRVDDRIAALLARCERLTTAKDMHVLFDQRGQCEANQIAQRDQENNRG